MGSISPRSHYAIDVGFEVVSTSTTTEYRHNLVADGQVIAVHTIDQNGSAHTSYLHYDHLGSVDAITNDQGSVIQAMSFDAFGLRRDATNWDYDLSQNTIATLKDYTDRGYTDQEELDNLSLVDLNGRVYDPTVGRMISADPTVPDPLYTQAFDRYSYVYNSPFQYVDPSGYGPDSGYTLIFCVGSAPCVDNPQPPPPPTFIPLPSGPSVPVPVPLPIPSPGPLPNPSPVPGPPQAPAPPSAPTPNPGSGNQASSCDSYGCNSPDGGNNGVMDAMNSTDGAQTCDEACYAFVATFATPTVTDSRHYIDGPGNEGNLVVHMPVLPRQPGVGPMRRVAPIIGTIGTPTPILLPQSPSPTPAPPSSPLAKYAPLTVQIPNSPLSLPSATLPCPGGATPSRTYNPNLGRNMLIGAGVVGGGLAIVGVVAINIVGFPEVVEGGEAILFALAGEPITSSAVAGFTVGGLGLPLGFAAGGLATPPVAPCP